MPSQSLFLLCIFQSFSRDQYHIQWYQAFFEKAMASGSSYISEADYCNLSLFADQILIEPLHNFSPVPFLGKFIM